MSRKFRWMVRAALLLVLLSIVLPLYAVYWLQRPITDDGGRIRQGYLWGEDAHHGVDFSYSFGTYVYAIADGEVVQIVENVKNNEWPPNNNWGNFVLIRHSWYSMKLWDRTTQQNAYLYSIYAHLKQWSVRPSVGDFVSAGTWIAEVDNTGHSTGHHLHLQVCLHPQPDRLLWPTNTLNSENTSRNPELWLQPFNYGGTNTGAVVGKLTDSDGQPIGDRYIWGLSKPLGSGGTTYWRSRTYAHTWTNPDDILVENWGTTDVLPGTYHLTVRNESGSYIYEDLGWHTVGADETTYVGLYPVYLPDIMEDYYGWTSSILIRNNSNSKTAQVNTTFFWEDSSVGTQATNYIVPQGAVVVDFSGTCSGRGSALVAASENVSVVVRNTRGNEITIYNGIRASGGSPGWEQVGTTLYAPVAKNNWYGRSSIIEVLNAGSDDTHVTVRYYLYDSGQQQGDPSTRLLAPNARATFYARSECPSGQYCTAVITSSNGQPLAAVVREYERGGGAPTTYNAFSAAGSTGYAPMVKKNWGDSQNTGVTVMNTSSQQAQVNITYYGDDDTNPGYEYNESYSLAPRSVHCSWAPSLPLPDPFLGSAVVNATQDVVVLVGEQGAEVYKSTNGFLGGAAVAYVPELFNYASGPWSGITVQNLDASQTARVRIHYYNPDGSFRQTIGPRDISAGEEHSFHYWNNGLPDDFHGSGWVESEGGQSVGVLVNESWALGGVGYDGQASFNGSQP
jgi:hypothetical protein